MGELPSVDNNQDPSSYFFSGEEEVKKPPISDKFRPVFTAIKYYSVQAWPYVSRVMSAIVYFLSRLIKSTFHMMVEQVKNFKGE